MPSGKQYVHSKLVERLLAVLLLVLPQTLSSSLELVGRKTEMQVTHKSLLNLLRGVGELPLSFHEASA